MAAASEVPTILDAWVLGPIGTVEPLIEDRVFRIDRPARPSLVLKDCGVVSGAPIWNFPFYAKVMEHLERCGIAVPVLVPDRAGRVSVEHQGRTFTLAKFLPAGAPPVDPAEVDVLHTNIGRAIAEMHIALAAFPMDGVERETWRQDFATEAGPWAAEVASIAEHRSVMRRFQEEQLGDLEECLSGLPEQLIHRDCHLGNVVVDGTSVVGFIDCDHICIASPILDLAYLFVQIVKWVLDDVQTIDAALGRFSLVLSGYADRRALSELERRGLPYAMFGVALNFAWWFRGMAAPPIDIAIDVRALDWMMQNLDRLREACSEQPADPRLA